MILFIFLVLSFFEGKITSTVYNIMISGFDYEALGHYAELILQIPVLLIFILNFYLFSCVAMALIEKEKKITLSFYELKQFLKISKTKIIISFNFIIFSFIWQVVVSALYSQVVRQIGFENMIYYTENVFPIIFFILLLLKLYLFVCIAGYLVEKKHA
ncbi:hypothetical protein K0B03_03715 [Patescibacteria group bacterium]|nr:hypothetical protein [Patescibacteria group bacterium]